MNRSSPMVSEKQQLIGVSLPLYLPECWQDEQRMNNLMANFRCRDVNPLDYDNKMKFWANLIANSSEELHCPCFTLRTLQQRFKRNGKLPAGLRTVLAEMRRTGEVVPIDEFCTARSGWIGWGVNVLIKKPISWLFGGSVAPSNETADVDTVEFVIPSVVKAMARDVVDQHCASVSDTEDPSLVHSNLYEWSAFARQMKNICPTEQSLELVTLQLQCDNHASVSILENGQKVIKFKDLNQKNDVLSPVTEIDAGVLRIRQVQAKLQSAIEALEAAIQRFDNQARTLLRQGQKSKAKLVLKKKILAQRELAAKDGSLDKLQSLMYNLQNSHSQREIVDAYKAGATAFKRTLNESGLSPENVDKTIDEIHDVFADHEDICEALKGGIPGAAFGGQSDAELEEELEELLAAEDSLKRVDQRLPEVPSAAVRMLTPEREKRERQLIESSSSEDSRFSDRLKRLRAELESPVSSDYLV